MSDDDTSVKEFGHKAIKAESSRYSFTQQQFGMATKIKAPQFSTQNPKLWFAQVEAQFSTNQVVTERTKFDLVIPLLDTRVASEVERLILEPPAVSPYSDLKAALIKCFSKSEEARISQLLDKERLGDRTPSQHLRHLRALVPGIDDVIIKARWLSHMPNEIQVCLEAFADATLEKLAESADRMVERLSLKPQVAATIVPPTSESSEVATLRREVAQLTKQLKNMSTNRSRPRSRSRSRPQATKKHDLCWYHWKYGKHARTCVPGCKWQGNASENQ
ncbi:uncharacterized protein LOC118756581 [Rhagoletis pomonella]|uniref:uncharacterized protein LOC118756581 n=1 Tax=Rhagoletis pomonella TaxID=28610 RepID=UPI00177EFED7|nr:uncharacterized protein LOC118756581 [Rhagoletis pomonella]